MNGNSRDATTHSRFTGLVMNDTSVVIVNSTFEKGATHVEQKSLANNMMAQRLARRAEDREVPGSSPVRD